MTADDHVSCGDYRGRLTAWITRAEIALTCRAIVSAEHLPGKMRIHLCKRAKFHPGRCRT